MSALYFERGFSAAFMYLSAWIQFGRLFSIFQPPCFCQTSCLIWLVMQYAHCIFVDALLFFPEALYTLTVMVLSMASLALSS